MIFNSPSELENYLMKQMKLAIEQAEKKIHKVIDEFLKKYYGEYAPVEYERTYQLLHSLVKSDIVPKGRGYECHVYFDLDKIDYSFKYINGHKYRNVGYGSTITKEGIVGMAMEGETHGGYKAPQNTAIWTESMKILNHDKIQILRQCLLDNGIPIK